MSYSNYDFVSVHDSGRKNNDQIVYDTMKSTNACIRNYLSWYHHDPDESGILLIAAIIEFAIIVVSIPIIINMFTYFVTDDNLIPIAAPWLHANEIGVYFIVSYIVFDSIMLFRCISFRKRLIEAVRISDSNWNYNKLDFIISKKHTYIGLAIKVAYLPFAIIIILMTVNVTRNCDIIVNRLSERYNISFGSDLSRNDKIALTRNAAVSIVAVKDGIDIDDLLFDTNSNTFVLRQTRAAAVNREAQRQSLLKTLTIKIFNDYDRDTQTTIIIETLQQRLQNIRNKFITEKYTFLNLSHTVDMHIAAMQGCLDKRSLITAAEVNSRIAAATEFCDGVENIIKGRGI